MKGYEWGKGTVKCGFCGIHGHNITTCSAVPIIYQQYVQQVHNSSGAHLPTAIEKKALKEMMRREQRGSNSPAKKRKPRCSFCNSLKHKRNRCPKLAKFKAKVKKANRNWRRCFVNEANSHGFGIGSLVSVPVGLIRSSYFHEQGEALGIISGFDKNKLNVFCSYDRGGQFCSVPAVNILVETETLTVAVPRLKANWSKELIPNRSKWQFYEVLSVKSDASYPQNDWYEDSDEDEAMKWFFKNISTKSRDFPMLLKLIQKWTKIDLPNTYPP